MMAEQEVTSLQGQLTSARKALEKSQAENDKLKKQLHKQVSELNGSWFISIANWILLSTSLALMRILPTVILGEKRIQNQMCNTITEASCVFYSMEIVSSFEPFHHCL